MIKHQEPLPIDEVLGDVRRALAEARVLPSSSRRRGPARRRACRSPCSMSLGSRRGKILVLEPRRLAARAAASRMAHLLGERLGETIGLRARLASKVGPKSRIEVVTEGVFTRMILADPALDGVAAVLFDEFHERSLDADLGLALALDCRRGLREDLRLLVMSATLEAARVADLLGGAPVIASEGRSFPVETRYLGRSPGARIEDQVSDAVMVALKRDAGSVLAFLPGQGEIRRTEERLRERITDPGIDLAPLYGALDPAAQDRALLPAPAGRRKVVLATSIAETSLTIEGVSIVVDSGLARVPRYEPGAGVTRLETVRVSRASADQRRGRAGRTRAGDLLPPLVGTRDGKLAGLRRARDQGRGSFRPRARLRGVGRGRACHARVARFPAHGRARGGAGRASGPRRARCRETHHGPRQEDPCSPAAAAPRLHGDRGRKARRRARSGRHRGGAGRARSRGQRYRPLPSPGGISPRPLAPRRRHAPPRRRLGARSRERRQGGRGRRSQRPRRCSPAPTPIASRSRVAHPATTCSRAGAGRVSTPPTRWRARASSSSPRCRARRRQHASCLRLRPTKRRSSTSRDRASRSATCSPSIARRWRCARAACARSARSRSKARRVPWPTRRRRRSCWLRASRKWESTVCRGPRPSCSSATAWRSCERRMPAHGRTSPTPRSPPAPRIGLRPFSQARRGSPM